MLAEEVITSENNFGKNLVKYEDLLGKFFEFCHEVARGMGEDEHRHADVIANIIKRVLVWDWCE